MLDILANNKWERPIYFTGGSYSPSEYIWMKEYLQLEGLVYKLVPIRTPLNTHCEAEWVDVLRSIHSKHEKVCTHAK
jgi:uncharacterized protein YqgV (UPF0045/DUF77 family)